VTLSSRLWCLVAMMTNMVSDDASAADFTVLHFLIAYRVDCFALIGSIVLDRALTVTLG